MTKSLAYSMAPSDLYLHAIERRAADYEKQRNMILSTAAQLWRSETRLCMSSNLFSTNVKFFRMCLDRVARMPGACIKHIK